MFLRQERRRKSKDTEKEKVEEKEKEILKSFRPKRMIDEFGLVTNGVSTVPLIFSLIGFTDQIGFTNQV